MFLRATATFLLCLLVAAVPTTAHTTDPSPVNLSALTHVKSVLILMSPSPGRGNVAAAINHARSLRRHGYTKKISIYIPTRSAHYNPLTIRDFLPTLALPDRSLSHIIEPQDIILEPNTRPIRISGGALNQLPLSPMPDVVISQDLDVPAQLTSANWSTLFNYGSLEEGYLEVFVNNATIKWNRALGVQNHPHTTFGTYSDPVVEAARQLRSQPNGTALLRQEIITLLAQSPREAASAATISQYKDFSTIDPKCLGVIYGVGFKGEHMVAGYLSSLANQAEEICPDQGVMILSASRLSTDELKTISRLAKKAQKTQYSFDDSVRKINIIDLMRGKKLPAKLSPKEITFVHVGGFSHDVYARLLVLADLPPVISGDSALSAAIAAGKPFIVKPSYNNSNTTDRLNTLLGDHYNLDFDLAEILFPTWEENTDNITIPEIDFVMLKRKRPQQLFQRLSSDFARPLAVNLVLAAEQILASPKTKRSQHLTTSCEKLLEKVQR